MFFIDISNMLGWWTLVLGAQIIAISTYFFFNNKKNKEMNLLNNKVMNTWKPVPFIEDDVTVEEPPVMGKIDENEINVGSTSFLCLNKEQSVFNDALKSLAKYGVGSCGPRGFYGTIDVHLELEERLAKFLQVEETCVYSYGFSTIASAIPSYAKRRDIIFADECVWFAIQKGLDASRSTVHYFNHNNPDHLEELLEEALRKRELNPRRRAFLVIEAIYMNTGAMVPLKRMVKLARKYQLRIILDESLTIGVLGEHGRGITELLEIPRDEIDLIVGSLENSFASVGGFCAGTHFIVDHQRLSGLGYCFSASQPPMLTQAAISGLDIIETNPRIIYELNDACIRLNKALCNLKYYNFRGNDLSPIKHVYIKKCDLTERLRHSYLREITTYCHKQGVAMTVASYLRDAEHKCPEPSIRLAVNRNLTDEKINLICTLLDKAYEEVGPKPELQAI